MHAKTVLMTIIFLVVVGWALAFVFATGVGVELAGADDLAETWAGVEETWAEVKADPMTLVGK